MKQILGNSIKYKELIRSPLLSFRWIEQPVLKTVSGTPEHHWVALLICSIFRQFSLTPEEKSRICIALNLASTQNREMFPTALTCLASEICFSPTSESAANTPISLCSRPVLAREDTCGLEVQAVRNAALMVPRSPWKGPGRRGGRGSGRVPGAVSIQFRYTCPGSHLLTPRPPTPLPVPINEIPTSVFFSFHTCPSFAVPQVP